MYDGICLECGNNFSTKYENIKFCSYSCAAFYNKRKGIGVDQCLYCSIDFIKQNKNHIFCSTICKRKYEREHDIIELICSECETKFDANRKDSLRYKNHFCSRECESNFREKESHDLRCCENCKKKFECKKHDKLRFCSIACQGEWQSKTRIGKDSATYKHGITDNMRTKKCERCGKEMIGTPKSFEKQKFCSVGCRIRSMNKTMTAPHVAVTTILEENNIEFSIEHSIKRFSIDCFIYDRFAIEIMGTYWHCDPRFYKIPIDNIQEHSISSDSNKNKYLNYLYIPVLYIWEYDIATNTNVCEKLILKFLKNNGILENYHSMNYSISGRGVRLNDKILVPRFEK